MIFTFYEESHIGGRNNNQDFYAHIIETDWSCFVVADGLGGHDRGEVASEEFCRSVIILAKNFIDKIAKEPIKGMQELILSAVTLMKKNILKSYSSIDTQTTFALTWLSPQRIITSHVGDSRIYRINPTAVTWRSSDHTVVQQLFDKGEITEEDFSNHPLQNRLLNTINLYQTPNPEIHAHPPLGENEVLLLCTDGFWTQIRLSEFLQIAVAKKFSQTIHDMIEEILANHPKSADNITIQAIKL